MSDLRLLFLDFDGVLHPLPAEQTAENFFGQLPHLMKILERCPETRIVISSSWQGFGIDYCTLWLEDAGRFVIGGTQSLRPQGPRPANRYEAAQAIAREMNVDRWVIVDDQPSMVFGDAPATPAMMARVVFTDPVILLNDLAVDQVVRRLA